MDNQLARVNSGLGSPSVTAAQFLRERLIHVREMTPGVPAHQTFEHRETAMIGTAKYPLHEKSAGAHVLNERNVSVLEMRRIETERGEGSDHDLPYSFALPQSWPLVLAWMKLLAKVHTGALLP